MEYEAIDESKEYNVYPARFLVSTLFGLVQMMTSVLMNTLNPIASELSIVYNYEPIIINLGTLCLIQVDCCICSCTQSLRFLLLTSSTVWELVQALSWDQFSA